MACQSPTGNGLQSRYRQHCQRHGATPSSGLLQALEKFHCTKGVMELKVEHMEEPEVRALVEVLESPEVLEALALSLDASNSSLCGAAALTLVQGLQALQVQLKQLNLSGNALGRDALRVVFQSGLGVETLDVSCCRVRKIDIYGQFEHLQSLKLDYNPAITHLPKGCFQSAPQLAKVSLCGTSISNLFMTTAALGSLKKLIELRFQRCACCAGTGACTAKRRLGLRSNRTPETEPLLRWRQGRLFGQETDWSALEDSSDDELDTSDHFSPSDLTMRTEEDEDDSEPEAMHEDDPDVANSAFPGFPLPRQQALSQPAGALWQVHQAPPVLDLPSRSPRRLHSPRSTLRSPCDPPALSLNFPRGESSGTSGLSDSDFSSSQENAGSSRIVSCDNLERPIFFEGGERLNPRRVPGARSPGGLRSPRSRALGESLSLSVMVNGAVVGLIAAHSPPASPAPAKVHPAPICLHKHYRVFMLTTLPNLKVLDNTAVSANEVQKAHTVYRENFEPVPNARKGKECITDTIARRELGGSRGVKRPAPSPSRGPAYEPVGWSDRTACSPYAFQRDLTAAAMSNTVWPAIRTVSTTKSTCPELQRRFRPRQFEYHPTEPNLMVFGTLHGEVVVINHETDEEVGHVQSVGAPHSILGLCWLNRDPNKLIAGSDNGSIQLYDVNKMRASLVQTRRQSTGLPAQQETASRYDMLREPTIYTYENFDQLTSVHINCTDEIFLTSGYSNHVGLYDLCTGKRLQIFPNLHREHINVLKFAHHNPNLFVTSSFDRDIKMWDLRQKVTHPLYVTQSGKGNVMVCFSRDDHFLLTSAVDNEVCQRIASDGRLHLKFDIAPTNSSHNYTRSYYMNNRDYIVSGSCEENVVRICCSKTGRRLRDITFQGKSSKSSLYVQSLRGDPFRDFHFSVLAAYNHPNSRSEIVKVNLLSGDTSKDRNGVADAVRGSGLGG